MKGNRCRSLAFCYATWIPNRPHAGYWQDCLLSSAIRCFLCRTQVALPLWATPLFCPIHFYCIMSVCLDNLVTRLRLSHCCSLITPVTKRSCLCHPFRLIQAVLFTFIFVYSFTEQGNKISQTFIELWNMDQFRIIFYKISTLPVREHRACSFL